MSPIVHRLSLVLSGAVLGVALTTAQGVFAESDQKEPPSLEELLGELRTFADVFAKIKEDYVEPVEDTTLLESAIHGMLAGLDPHSAYLVPEDYRELQEGTSGEFGGLGIEVGMEDGFVKVIAPIDDTPAQRAGVQAGDLVIRLDDTPVKGMTLNDAVKIMRGKPGTDITLTIIRDGEQKPLTVTITRAVIKVASVKHRSLEPGYGYLRITQFQSRTGNDLRKAVADLKDNDSGDLKGVVLDLRNNPGGVLSAAVEVTDSFLSNGLIVYTEGRMDDAALKFNAKPSDILDGAPLVVLVNGGSASASEIVAGALKDHKRGVIMGSKTFGKGSVQTILPMENGSALKLTTARYFTPSGTSIQAKGIVPDIVLDDVKLARVEKTSGASVKESDLARHLSNGARKPSESTGTKQDDAGDKDNAAASLASKDYALHEALNLLKGLAILKDKAS